MLRSHLTLLVFLLVITGCVSGRWYKSGATEATFNHDAAECRYAATVYGYIPSRPVYGYYRTYGQAALAGALQGIAEGLEQSARKNDIFTACMNAKGYTWMIDPPSSTNTTRSVSYVIPDNTSPKYHTNNNLPQSQLSNNISALTTPTESATSPRQLDLPNSRIIRPGSPVTLYDRQDAVNGSVITRVDGSTPVTLLAESGAWSQVQVMSGEKGWLLKCLVK